MGHKIFVSYKYADDSVKNLNYFENSTVRDYVDKLEDKIDNSNHIFKGESDGEDLSNLSNDEIWEKLKDRIYDSTLTIVFISPKMKDNSKSDREQWIPWEISYSLKEVKRRNEAGQSVTSKTNAMIAVVLPDVNNSYNYYLEEHVCCWPPCRTHHTDKLFKILRENKFNKKNPTQIKCQNDSDKKIYSGECSYIKAVKWGDFIDNIDKYIDEAYERQNNIEDYDICKEL
ncbi:MAG: TIR domain-containing protein [Clostridia bacterium]|nr:TIR domain-containing protein [Clostridia bacterium]MBR2289666.1 TIR domain-containing protein [Clostridia bacterium]